MVSGQCMKQDCAYMYAQIQGNQPDGGLMHLFNGVKEAPGFVVGRQIKKHQTAGYGHPGKRCQSKRLHQARKPGVRWPVGELYFYQRPQIFEDRSQPVSGIRYPLRELIIARAPEPITKSQHQEKGKTYPQPAMNAKHQVFHSLVIVSQKNPLPRQTRQTR
jgi:hypothetical protein